MNKFLPILCLLIIASCSKEIPFDQLVERNGVTYEVNSQTPFTGSSVKYYGNGQLKMKLNYKDGKQDGLTEYYYGNGQLEMKGNMKDGELDGLWVQYDPYGQLKSRDCIHKDVEVDMSYCEK